MHTFVIIFRQGSPPPTAEERQQIAQKIVDWAQRQNAAGHKLDPRILARDSAHRGGSVFRSNERRPGHGPPVS